jgi:hypothetical protein
MAENTVARQPNPEGEKRTIVSQGQAKGVKRVLFVCIANTGASHAGMGHFKEAMAGEKLNVRIEMDTAGTCYIEDLRAKLSKADFVIPMSPYLVPKIRAAMKGLEKKPRILDARLLRHASLPARYKLLFRKVAGTRRRARAQRPL